jgi:hypothetical protein
MNELRSGATRDRLRGLIEPKTSNSEWRASSALGRHSVHHTSIGPPFVAAVPEVTREIAHRPAGFQVLNALQLDAIERPGVVVRWITRRIS